MGFYCSCYAQQPYAQHMSQNIHNEINKTTSRHTTQTIKKTNIHKTNCRELEDCAHFEVCDTDILYFAYVCSVNHGGCGATTGYYETEEEAIEAWNRRADDGRD